MLVCLAVFPVPWYCLKLSRGTLLEYWSYRDSGNVGRSLCPCGRESDEARIMLAGIGVFSEPSYSPNISREETPLVYRSTWGSGNLDALFGS